MLGKLEPRDKDDSDSFVGSSRFVFAFLISLQWLMFLGFI